MGEVSQCSAARSAGRVRDPLSFFLILSETVYTLKLYLFFLLLFAAAMTNRVLSSRAKGSSSWTPPPPSPLSWRAGEWAHCFRDIDIAFLIPISLS